VTSSISPARQNLFAALHGYSDLGDPVQVTYGAPSSHEAAEVVAMLGVQTPSAEEQRGLGQRRVEETYVLDVAVKVHDPGADQAEAVDLRGFDLADAVRQVVRQNITLDGAVRTALVVSQSSEGAQPAQGGGWVIFVKLGVECKARVD